MLDIFVECSSLKSFSHGIEVDKVKYFFWKLYATVKEKASTLHLTSCFSLIHVYMVNGLLDNLIYFNCSQLQMHSDPLKH